MFEIAQNSGGRLWIMPCPDGACLTNDVERYRAAGATCVVSMLAHGEAEMLGLAREGEICSQAGLEFQQHPIVDFGLPNAADFAALVASIKSALESGQGVAVHCRAGIGRSGMVTAGVLVAQGSSADQAMATVAHARGVSIPDTVEQGNFVHDFAHSL